MTKYEKCVCWAKDINKAAGTPMEYFNGKQINVGHYYIDSVGQGYMLAQVVTEGGGIKHLETEILTPGELLNVLRAFHAGILIGKGLK